MIRKIAVFGVGLIGASACLAYKQKHPDVQITGYGRNADNLTFAQNSGIIDAFYTDMNCPDADLILLSTPAAAAIRIAERLRELGYRGHLTDAVSTKTAISTEAIHPDWQGRFIPAHPIAGTEKSGARAAFASLFDDKITILTPPSKAVPSAIELVQHFWESCGSKIEILTAEEHDRIYSWVSHAPHIFIFALSQLMHSEFSSEELAVRSGGGLRGLLRIGASSPEMWSQILQENQRNILPVLQKYIAELKRWETAIQEQRWSSLEDEILQTSKITTKYLNSHTTIKT